MLTRSMKAAFFALTGPLMKLNGAIHRTFRAPRNGTVKAHLGPGQQRYIKGWINVDANMFTAKCEVWADLRNKLPFPDASVDAFYSHHMIEHLPNIQFHFNDIYRCLKPGGVLRIGAPNGDTAINRFLADDKEWFGDFPDNRSSIGGRFENFIFCRQEHLSIVTASYLDELTTNAGFIEQKMCQPIKETNYPDFYDGSVLGTEYELTPEYPHTILIEAKKAASS